MSDHADNASSKDSSPATDPPVTAKPSITAEDRLAAHEFLTEMRTRIALVRIPYQFGVNERALESLYELFGLGRALMRKYPRARVFGEEVIRCLNEEMRKVTGKWHWASDRGELSSRDGGDEFLADFAQLQKKLVTFSKQLYEIAYPGETMPTPGEVGVMAGEIGALMQSVPYGIPAAEEVNGGIKACLVTGINRSERAEVEARRDAGCDAASGGRKAGMDAFGLALSGGGIRSASFSLGVIQVLAEKGLMPQVDFLSTVSGGGYTGSFVTAEIGERGAASVSQGGDGSDGSAQAKAAGRDERWNILACPDGPDSGPIRTMRHQARYLIGDRLWTTWGMVTSTVAGTLLNWTAPLAVLCFVSALTTCARDESPVKPGWPLVLWFSLVVAGVSFLGYFASHRHAGRFSKWPDWTLGGPVLVGLVAGLAWVLTRIYAGVFMNRGCFSNWQDLVSTMKRSSGWIGGLGFGGVSLGVISALIPAVARFVPFLPRVDVRRAVLKVAMYAAGVFLPLLAVAVYLFLVAVGSVEKLVFGCSGLVFLWILGGVLLLIALFVININMTGPHRLYRDALSRTFVEGGGKRGNGVVLDALNPSQLAPYHLINAAVNLPGTEEPANRERSCDFFVFSKCWSGSPVVGYRKTGKWLMNGQPADLATAMAISGAAVSSHMGIGSIRPLRSLLTLLNVRLGFWIRNAAGGHASNRWLKKLANSVPAKHPGFHCLLREITGLWMTEKARWLNLSDGGHIENMGLYELLRRRCKFMVCVDGESDGAYGFQGLMNVVRYAQIDLGIRMEPDLSDLRPDGKTGLSRSHYHLMRVHYPKDGTDSATEPMGLLLYLKLSVTGNESELIRRYRARHPEFPHQTTLDQFFDQEQFEAYRQLGVHVARGVFAPCLMGSGSGGSKQALTVGDWFEQLARHLLFSLNENRSPGGAAEGNGARNASPELPAQPAQTTTSTDPTT